MNRNPSKVTIKKFKSLTVSEGLSKHANLYNGFCSWIEKISQNIDNNDFIEKAEIYPGELDIFYKTYKPNALFSYTIDHIAVQLPHMDLYFKKVEDAAVLEPILHDLGYFRSLNIYRKNVKVILEEKKNEDEENFCRVNIEKKYEGGPRSSQRNYELKLGYILHETRRTLDEFNEFIAKYAKKEEKQ